MRIAPIILAAALMLPATAWAQKESSNPPVRPNEPNDAVPAPRRVPAIVGQIYIGDPAPNFVLENANGKEVELAKLHGDWIVLIFSDQGQRLREYRGIDDDMRKLGARIVGVCREKGYRMKSIAQRDSLPFTILGDVTGQIAALYGLYDRLRSEIEPGFVVIDRYGVVRTAVLGQLMPSEEVAQITRICITGLD
jgi:peroxiredoxin